MDAVWTDAYIFAFRNERSMQYDLIYPDDESKMRETLCVVTASYFSAEELVGFGVGRNKRIVY